MKPIKQKKPRMPFSDSDRRIYGMVIFVFFAATCILIKLYTLQIKGYSTYAALAENQHEGITELSAKRGEIFLQDENDLYSLAVNRELQMAYAVPREMKNIGDSIKALSEILSLDKDFLEGKLNSPNDMFEVLKHKLSEDEVQKIKDAKINGVHLSPEVFRYYPAGELAAQVVGFVGSNGNKQVGMYGLEAYWEEELSGQAGVVKQESDSQGRWISVSERDIMKETRDGPDLILTVNHTVQFEVEKILREALEGYKADSGTIIVMEPKTGKILAMANYPGFNPNDFSSTEEIARFMNPAVSEPYECGSVFKAVTEAIGIDTGKINPNTTYTDTGVVMEAGYEIHNSDMKANGTQTMTQVLEKSLNTGVIYIEKLVGNKIFFDYVQRFGFGQKSGVTLPGEVSGNIANLKNPNTTINFFTASFGQGISVTPMQLVSAYAALANRGILMKPQIVDKLRYSDGHEEEIHPEEVRQVISESSSQQISQMLRSVVVNGHGKRADVAGYLVGGKTGTAQIAKSNDKGYEEGMNIGSFAGYAPINDPRFVVLVKMVNPKTVEWAESSAAPTFGQIMKFLLEYYKVQPTEDPAASPLAKMPALAWPPGQTENQDAIQTVTVSDDKKESNKNKESKKSSRIITSGD